MNLIAPLHIRKNDLQPYYYGQVKDGDGAVVDITGATIYCTMKDARSGGLKINRQTDGIELSDPEAGKFYYAWQSGETNTAGKYYIEFEINPQSGGKFTIPGPRDENAEVIIHDSLDAS